jgi:hypothetical protein
MAGRPRFRAEVQWAPVEQENLETPTMAYVFESVPADRGLIDLDDPREVNWWRKRFGCSEDQLRHAVDQVGNSAANVEQLLDGSEIVTL